NECAELVFITDHFKCSQLSMHQQIPFSFIQCEQGISNKCASCFRLVYINKFVCYHHKIGGFQRRFNCFCCSITLLISSPCAAIASSINWLAKRCNSISYLFRFLIAFSVLAGKGSDPLFVLTFFG